MRWLKTVWIILGVACLLAGQAWAKGLERMEPASWWIGLKEPHLELMIHGEGAARWMPSLSYPGVTLRSYEAGDNPNYLYVTLEIAATARPGPVPIRFAEHGRVVAHRNLVLQAREQGSAGRQGFSAADAIYLITPDRFANGDPRNDLVKGLKEIPNRSFHGGRHGGDIAGVIQHLDYITGLGFTQLWLNPVLENDQPNYSYHGYSTTDFYKVDPRYGTNADMRRLSDAARAKGAGLIMDMIVNHIGSEHWWMRDPPSHDWINNGGVFKPTNHIHSTQMDVHAAPSEAKTFEQGWFAESLPDLNQTNPHLATYLIQNSIWWIEYANLSGVRMDTYPYPNKDFMAQWSARIMAEYPHFTIVGEEWSRHPPIVAYWQAGVHNRDGYVSHLPSLMDFPVQYALIEALKEPENTFPTTGLLRLYEMIANDFIYADPAKLVIFADNHDMDRAFTQLGQDLSLDKMALGVMATLRGVPQIYYGTEILMQNPQSHEHGIIRSDFPGGWAGDAVNAFTGQGLSPEQREVQEFTRKLFTWRRTQPALHDGKMIHFYPAPDDPGRRGVYVYGRVNGTDGVLVALNKNTDARTLPTARFADVLAGRIGGTDVISGGHVDLRSTLTLPPRSITIIDLD